MKRFLVGFLLLTQGGAQTPSKPLDPVQVVLDEVFFKGSRFKTTKIDLQKPLDEMFQKAGFTVLAPKATPTPDAFQVRFMVVAITDRHNRVAYQISARASQGKDIKVKENLPGQPERVWFANITAASSDFEDGITEIHHTLAGFSTVLYHLSARAAGKDQATVAFPVTYPVSAKSALINPVEFQNRGKLKVKEAGFQPPWPREALERRTSGTVAVELMVGEDGIPLRARIKQGPPELYLHALEWALGYEFEPIVVDGKPVKSKIIFQLGYKQDSHEDYSIM